MTSILEGRKLTKRYGELLALDQVDIEVHPGRVTAIIGPSGSGKTSLLLGLSLLERPDSGSVHLNGTIYHLPIIQRDLVPSPWPKVTIVFQKLFLWPHLTLRQNVLLG